MSKTSINQPNFPATDSLDPEVLAFGQAFEGRSPIDAEVESFIETHQDRRDLEGKNYSLPAKEIRNYSAVGFEVCMHVVLATTSCAQSKTRVPNL